MCTSRSRTRSTADCCSKPAKRFGRGVQFNANYTLSHATDETTDYNSDFEPNNQLCRRCDRASSSFDERHKVVAYAVLQSPSSHHALLRNWVFSPIYQYHSGQPFNLLVGGLDVNNDRHNTNDRPPYAGRNTGLGPSFWTFDTRLQRGFKLTEKARLDLMLEAFNLFNKLNYRKREQYRGRNLQRTIQCDRAETTVHRLSPSASRPPSIRDGCNWALDCAFDRVSLIHGQFPRYTGRSSQECSGNQDRSSGFCSA